MWLMCHERNRSICYTTAKYEYPFQNKKIIKIHFCLSFFLLHLFLLSCKFLIIETRAHDMAHNDNAINSKLYIRVRSKAATGVLQQKLLKIFAIFTEKYLCWKFKEL